MSPMASGGPIFRTSMHVSYKRFLSVLCSRREGYSWEQDRPKSLPSWYLRFSGGDRKQIYMHTYTYICRVLMIAVEKKYKKVKG